jgi:hypothetical protein
VGILGEICRIQVEVYGFGDNQNKPLNSRKAIFRWAIGSFAGRLRQMRLKQPESKEVWKFAAEAFYTPSAG